MKHYCPDDGAEMVFAIRYLSDVCPKCWTIWCVWPDKLERCAALDEQERHRYL